MKTKFCSVCNRVFKKLQHVLTCAVCEIRWHRQCIGGITQAEFYSRRGKDKFKQYYCPLEKSAILLRKIGQKIIFIDNRLYKIIKMICL